MQPPQGLADLSRLLLADSGHQAVLTRVLALVRDSVPSCDGASITLLRSGRIETAAATDDDVARTDRRQYTRRQGPCYEAARTGLTRAARRLPDRRWPVLDAEPGTPSWTGVVGVPLGAGNATIGALNLYSRAEDPFPYGEVGVAELLAERAAQALTHARAFEEQQAMAATLQRSLLPPGLPPLPELAFAARYQPASTGINVGGDWYDVQLQADGTVVLAIGDVAGHGLAAAMTMAQLRTAVRAYAFEGHDPVEVLMLVDEFLARVEPEGYATCCVVLLDPGDGTVRWANAGHLDPVAVLPGQPARSLTGGHRPALGVPGPVARVSPGIAVLPPGSRLVLFTDGLVERRGESLDLGLTRLARAAAAPGADLQAWCDDLVTAQLGDREVGDDVAVLAVELATAARLADEAPRSKVAG